MILFSQIGTASASSGTLVSGGFESLAASSSNENSQEYRPLTLLKAAASSCFFGNFHFFLNS